MYYLIRLKKLLHNITWREIATLEKIYKPLTHTNTSVIGF